MTHGNTGLDGISDPAAPLPHARAVEPIGAARESFPFGWMAKQILLPFTPFIVGVMLRVFLVELQWSAIDPGELFISLAMLSVLLLVSAARKTDGELRDRLTYTALTFFIIFVAFFAVTSTLKIQADERLLSTFERVSNAATKGQHNVAFALLSEFHPRNEGPISKFRAAAIFLSCITIPLAIAARHRYKLTE